MKGIKRFFIWLGLILAISLAIGWWILNKKEEKSLSLYQHVPTSQYVARINTAQAMKLVLSLDLDSFKSSKKSKWSALFSDTTKTGIDFLVNPWIFGENLDFNVAFMLNAPQDFKAWMLEMGGTYSSVSLENGDSIFCNHLEENGITFCHNTKNIALVSKAKNWSEIARKFYNSKGGSTSNFVLGAELVQVKLNNPITIFKNLLVIKDTILKLEIDDNSLAINKKKKRDLPFDFYACLPINPEVFQELKEQDGFRNVLNIVGLKDLKLESSAIVSINIYDTLEKRTKSVTYGFDDNFNKIEKVKWNKTIVPNISMQFQFSNEVETDAFFTKNALFHFKSKDFKVIKEGSKILFYSSLEPMFLNEEMGQLLYINCTQIKRTIGYSPMLNTLPMGFLKGLDYLYLEQINGNTTLMIQSQINPVQWMFNNFKDAL